MQQLKYLLKVLSFPEVVGGGAAAQGTRLRFRARPLGRPENLLGKAFFPYIFLFSLMTEFLLQPQTLTSTE